jgi:hypothetical protein
MNGPDILATRRIPELLWILPLCGQRPRNTSAYHQRVVKQSQRLRDEPPPSAIGESISRRHADFAA